MLEEVTDTKENRRKGWRRMVLFGLTFQPAGIDILPLSEAIAMRGSVSPEMKALGEGAVPFDGGLYPWRWVKDDKPNFKALQGGLLVAPILQKLILNREPERVLAWADEVARWPIRRIIPAHLANNIVLGSDGGAEFRRAFDFLEEGGSNSGDGFGGILDTFLGVLGVGGKDKGKGGRSGGRAPTGDAADTKLLSDVSENLTKSGVLFPEAPLVRRR